MSRAEGSADNDNLTGAATGHRPDGGGLRRDLLEISVVGRAANALILGLVGRETRA
jgi:hypothetical protein